MSNKENERTEYVGLWVTPKTAERIKAYSNDKKAYENALMEYIKDVKDSLRSDIEGADEDIIQFKAKMITARDAFKAAKDEQLEATYELWEKYDAEISKVGNFVAAAKQVIIPLKNEVESLNNAVSGLNFSRLESCLNLIDRINNMSQQDREILEKLLELKKEQ